MALNLKLKRIALAVACANAAAAVAAVVNRQQQQRSRDEQLQREHFAQELADNQARSGTQKTLSERAFDAALFALNSGHIDNALRYLGHLQPTDRETFKQQLTAYLMSMIPDKAVTFKEQQQVRGKLDRMLQTANIASLGPELKQQLETRIAEEKKQSLGVAWNDLKLIMDGITNHLSPCCCLLFLFDLGKNKKYLEVTRAFAAAERALVTNNNAHAVVDVREFLTYCEPGEQSLLSAIAHQRIQQGKPAHSLDMLYRGLDAHCYGLAATLRVQLNQPNHHHGVVPSAPVILHTPARASQ